MIVPALAGLAAGAIHALSGPDHLAAVLPLAAESPARGPRIGLSWGLGHGLGTALLSALALGVRAKLHVDTVGWTAEAAIGVVLVLTGAWAIARARRPAHAHAAGAALGIGALHGVAGGTHVVVVLSALALPMAGALGWLAGFVAGAAAAMASLGWLCRRAGAVAPEAWLPHARVAAGTAAMVVGVGWLAASVAG